MAEAEQSLMRMHTAAQIAEMDAQTVRRFKRARWWILLAIALAGLIVGSIALDGIRGAPAAVAAYVEDASSTVMVMMDEAMSPVIMNLTIRLITLEEQLAYMTENCQCVVLPSPTPTQPETTTTPPEPTTTPPAPTTAPPSPTTTKPPPQSSSSSSSTPPTSTPDNKKRTNVRQRGTGGLRFARTAV